MLNLLRKMEVQRKLDKEMEEVYFDLPNKRIEKERRNEELESELLDVKSKSQILQMEEKGDVDFFKSGLNNKKTKKKKGYLQAHDSFNYEFIMQNLSRECYLAQNIVEAAINNRLSYLI